MHRSVYVDEAKRGDYLIAAVAVIPNDSAAVRTMLRHFILPGQRRLHMKAESDRRKRAIASAVARTAVAATIYNAGRRCTELERRAACLDALAHDLALHGDDRLILEQDDTLVSFDRRILYAAARRHSYPALRYEHERAPSQQLLALPDIVAWCWARGGEWRRRIQPIVVDVRTVVP